MRYEFFFDQRLNQTPPSALGFGYASANEIGQGPPFFNISGYTPIGGAITGPRNIRRRHTFEVQDSADLDARTPPVEGRRRVPAHRDRHVPGDRAQRVLRLRVDVPDQQRDGQPAARRAGDVLPGARATSTAALRVWNVGAYAQDEWRRRPRLTFNYGLRYERINPFTEAEDRLNGFVPGVQSTVRPDAPRGLVFPGDAGIGEGIAHSRERVHAAPRGRVGSHRAAAPGRCARATASSTTSSRTASGTASQVAISAHRPAAQFNQFSGAGLNFQNPYQGRPYPAPDTFVRPSTVFALDVGRQAAVRAELELSASSGRCSSRYLVEVRYVGARGTAPAAQRRGEPGRLRSRRDRAERRPAPHLRQLPGRRRHLRLLDDRDASQHHELDLPRRPGEPVAALPGRRRLQRVVLVLEGATTICRR